MDCDEALSRITERIGGEEANAEDAALRAHLAACESCAAMDGAAAEAVGALRRFEDTARVEAVPPTRVESLAAHVRRPKSGARRVLRGMSRAAVLLLAVAGAAALAGVEFRPRPESPQITPADVERAARLAADAVAERMEANLIARIDERAISGEASWQSALRAAEARRHEDVAVIVDAIVGLRRDVLATAGLRGPEDPTAGLPRLPDVR